MNSHDEHDQAMGGYRKWFLALGLSLLVMYPLTMAFIAHWSDFHLNLSNFYMAVAIGFVALFAVGIWLGRTEAFVGNEQFLRAMIPHHSRAILVCNQAQITDPDIAQLCDQIVSSQQEEIDLMEQMLASR